MIGLSMAHPLACFVQHGLGGRDPGKLLLALARRQR
jgi:hypothetical protein